MTQQEETQFSPAFVRRVALLIRQLADPAARRSFWRYWVADIAMGAGSYALLMAYACSPLMPALPSAGGSGWSWDGCADHGVRMRRRALRLRGCDRRARKNRRSTTR